MRVRFFFFFMNYVIEKLEQYPTSYEQTFTPQQFPPLVAVLLSDWSKSRRRVTEGAPASDFIGRGHVNQTVAWWSASSLSDARSSYWSCLLQWKYLRRWVDISARFHHFYQLLTEWVLYLSAVNISSSDSSSMSSSTSTDRYRHKLDAVLFFFLCFFFIIIEIVAL